jgi:hypothetical protein
MMMILASLLSLGSLVCFVIVLIKQFQTAGPLHGIIGLITCGIWTFIWGWMRASTLPGLKNIMMIWTLLAVVAIVLNMMGGMAALSGLRG